MADPAEVEAVAEALSWADTPDPGGRVDPNNYTGLAAAAIAALNAHRSSRGEDREGCARYGRGVCDCAGRSCVLDQHDDFPRCSCGQYIEGHDRVACTARSPQGEDHEADLRARSFSVAHVTGEKRPVVFLDVALAALSRMFPSPVRDTVRLVEKRVIAALLNRWAEFGDTLDDGQAAAAVVREALAEFPDAPKAEDDQIGRIVRFLVDAGYEAAAATVEIEFGCPPAE